MFRINKYIEGVKIMVEKKENKQNLKKNTKKVSKQLSEGKLKKVTGGNDDYSNEKCKKWVKTPDGIVIGRSGICFSCKFWKPDEVYCELGLQQIYM